MASNASLAALYRPQTFAEVVGQDMVKSILSRAAREDRVAPAYLLSGTRGVGKTTIARIFAKALNCEHAPTGEPCNCCDACRRITQGNFVDVVEIDGASNRGIDDIRRLRDAVGYAPLEGRYKVFIIDEAHMLTKEAFNALLKTLEEPPARVTFILATTEQHKFPVTIVSRCQNFVFRQIPEPVLERHVCSILEKEGRTYEPGAAALIARRAAGSVRDSMSLLGQVLALGGASDGKLTAAQVRSVLGLAGRETTDRMLDALASGDVAAVVELVKGMLDQGADIGFFLRELSTLWRNLFLIGQAGPDAARLIDVPPSERDRLAAAAARFAPAYVHAAWQMTLEAQRRILTSLEPASGLELLLLNLAMLPRLLPLEELRGPLPGREAVSPACAPSGNTEEPARPFAAGEGSAEPPASSPAPLHAGGHPASVPKTEAVPAPSVQEEHPVSAVPVRPFSVPRPGNGRDDAAGWKTAPLDGTLKWEDFLSWCGGSASAVPLPVLRQVSAEVRGNTVVISSPSAVLRQQLQRQEKVLSESLAGWAGRKLGIAYGAVSRRIRTEAELKAELDGHPVIRRFKETYDAVLVRCTSAGR